MLTKFVNYIAIVIVFLAGTALFVLKEKVSLLNYQLTETTKQCKEEKDKIHILQAEYAYLINPSRLSVIAANYLKLNTIRPDQLISDPLDKNNDLPEKTTSMNKVKRAHVKWRYKKPLGKYVNSTQTVSSKVR